eukprot:Colp12_sorted_trinity150504_noHs@17416
MGRNKPMKNMVLHLFRSVQRLTAYKGCASRLPSLMNTPFQLRVSSCLSLRPLATWGNWPSLAARAAEFPEVIRQWHPHKNTLRPESVMPGSGKKIWFLCDEGHEWEAVLY